ncbi:MAG: chromosome segregation protein SMC, partial [Wujia sp.]
DEAAGIVKYKKNKAATEKSLEAERANLSRVKDILGELEKQVGPLKEQSETARRYLIFKDELKKLDINAFLLDVDDNKDKLADYESKLSIVEEDVARLRDEYDAAKDEYAKIEEQIEGFNQKIDDTKNEIHEKKLINQKYEGETNVVSQQILSYQQNESGLQEQIEREKNNLERHQTELAKLYEEKNELDEKLDHADDQLDEAKNAYQELESSIAEKEKKIEDSKADIIEFLNEGGTLKAKVGRYDTMLENIQLRKTELNQRFLEYKSEEQKASVEKEQLSCSIAELESEIATVAGEHQAVCDLITSHSAKLEEHRQGSTQTSNQIVSLKSKKESLRNLTERYEGYGNSIRRVMEKKASNPKIIGVVADIMQVEKQYETAIETALGGSIQNIVTEDDATAKQMISYLKQNRFGRATFLPIQSIVERNGVDDQVKRETGVIGIASDLVQCEQKFRKIMGHLLGRIVVVDHIDHAMELAKKYKQSLRIVTLEGELINPGGALTGGAFRNSSNLLGRKRELEEIDEQIEAFTKQLEDHKNQIVFLTEDREKQKGIRDTYSKKLQDLNIRLNTFRLNLEQVNEKLDELEKGFAGIGRENQELTKQIDEINANKEELKENNKKQEDAIKELEEEIAQLEVVVASEKEKINDASEKINQMNLDFHAVQQQYDFMMQNIHRIKTEEQTAKENLKTLNLKLTNGNEQAQELHKKIELLKQQVEENQRLIAIKEEKLIELQNQKQALSDSHKEFFEKREVLAEQINGLDKSAFKINASIEKLSEHAESLNNYMWEEYELTYNSAIDFKDESFDDIGSLKREITAVKGKIKELGSVNVNAIEDYKQVSERYEFLKSQHDDIAKAEANLVNIIAELDRAMREQFAEKFQEIRVMFSKVFKELFGGGKADLELVDETDILETGIKINAQPPGKKLQNMMQLSGGEKSLTAISLLFAIQSLKPSPFCLLDEIEAALDDSNVKRFAKYLHRLTKDTQFIVITHRKGTMEVADILYGITMQEKGVSTLVSVNMIENELDD